MAAILTNMTFSKALWSAPPANLPMKIGFRNRVWPKARSPSICGCCRWRRCGKSSANFAAKRGPPTRRHKGYPQLEQDAGQRVHRKSSRLLKKSLRLRNEECKRDFLRLDAAQVRSFGVKSGRCSLALHVAGRASPLGAKSLGRRTML